MNRQNKPSREATQLTLWIAGLSRNEKIKFSALATPAVRPPERPWCGMKFIFDKKNGSLVVEIRFVGRLCFFFRFFSNRFQCDLRFRFGCGYTVAIRESITDDRNGLEFPLSGRDL